MAIPYAPSGTAGSVGRVAYSGYTFQDPGSQAYAAQNADRIDARYFLEPTQSNILGLWQAGGGLAVPQYSNKTFSCDASLEVGDPVRIGTDDAVVLATADTDANARVVAFCAEKPTSTTCYLSHFWRGTGSGLTAGESIYLTDAGGYSETPGTVATRLGSSLSTDEYFVSALPQEGISGASGFSGHSGTSGESGTSGFSGPSGISGKSGTSGISGKSGTSGSSGQSGTSGFSGTYSGYSGTSGFSGTYSGYSGTSGTSGFSGVTPTVSALARQFKLKTTNETRGPSGSLADDASLTAELESGKTYKFLVRAPTYHNYTGAGSKNAAVKVAFDGTFSSSYVWQYGLVSQNDSSGTGFWSGRTWTGDKTSPPAVNESIGIYCENWSNNTTWVLEGHITTTSAGTLSVQWTYTGATYQWTWTAGSSLEVFEEGAGMLAGESGYSGPSGTSGTSGFSGAFSGSSGTSGFSGEQGVSGASGTSGRSGTSGHSGTQGESGVSGGSGSSGSRGYSGQSGASGGSGHSGMEGSSGFSGIADSGYSGPSGTSGRSGASAWSGKSGHSGVSGAQGSSGASGAKGSEGDSGASGASGASALSGRSGASGFSGEQGDSGHSGRSGWSGTSSASGLSGASGSSGVQGDSGASGASGFSGTFSGESGVSGFSGPRGGQGDSGYSGAWGGIDTIQYVLDGGEYPISNGIKGTIWFSYAFEILDWIVMADQDGSIELDLWKSTYASFPPDATDSIVGTNNPIISSAQKARAVNMAGWTTTINADTGMTVYVVECSAITRCTLILKIRRT